MIDQKFVNYKTPLKYPAELEILASKRTIDIKSISVSGKRGPSCGGGVMTAGAICQNDQRCYINGDVLDILHIIDIHCICNFEHLQNLLSGIGVIYRIPLLVIILRISRCQQRRQTTR